MDFLFSIPYLFRIVLSLFGILVFQKLTHSLAAALALGTVLLALWIGHSPAAMADIAGERLFSLDMLFLALVILGVIWLSALMSEAGTMKDLVACLKTRLSKRAMLAALPAVVGLLPMPAGALFSAPLMNDADAENALPACEKSKINYWFRHVWEFCWPLYPGVLLAIDLSGLPIWQFLLVMFPLYFAAIGSGYAFLLRRVPNTKPEPGEGEDKAFFPLVLPTLTVIAVYALILVLFPSVARVNKYLPMFVGVVLGIVVLQLQRPATAEVWKRVVTSKRTLGLVSIIILARVYGAFIESKLADGMFLMDKIRGELDSYGIPTIILVILIPFISGLTTGITVGYIGASFPVVLSLAGTGTGEFFSTMIIGYSCGFIGMMLSPVHVCLIVSNGFFKTGMFESLSGLAKPALMLFACAALYSLLWATVA